MRHEFRLADIGEGLEEAEIITWLVQVGDVVRRDQPLIEVMTDKSNAELPAPTDGVIVELGGQVGDMISVGELVAVIRGTTDAATAVELQNEASPDDASVRQKSAASPSPAGTSGTAHAVAAVSSDTPPRPKASPTTRRVAAERNIDLSTIQGTGPGGRILLSDLETGPADRVESPTTRGASSVEAAAPPARPEPGVLPEPAQTAHVAHTPPVPTTAQPSGTIALRGVRRAVAKNMTASWSEIPHIHAFGHIDAEPLLELRASVKAKGGDAYSHVTPLTFFVAAVAQALAEHPEANASLNMADETIVYHDKVNVGVAVASEQGLVVPVVHGAEQMDFADLAVKLAEVVRGAREATLSREQFRGGTVTISNFGSLGGEQALPLIRPPESVIVGFGSIAQRPFVKDGAVVARSTMNTVIGTDHRLLDGDTTTTVLNRIGELLSDPVQLVL